VLTEFNQLLELDAVEIAVEIELLRIAGFCSFAHQPDDGLGLDLFLNVDRHRWDFQRVTILFILALPDELRVTRLTRSAWERS
jgi:hypothetical protein